MSKPKVNVLELVANEHRDLDAVEAAFNRLWKLSHTLGPEKAVCALTLAPIGSESGAIAINVNSMVAAFLVGFTIDCRSLKQAWVEALDYMGEQEDLLEG